MFPVLHAHSASTTPYRHRIFTDTHLRRMEETTQEVCGDFEAEPVEFNGEGDHVHLLVNHPPKIALSRPVDSLEGVTSRRMRRQFPDPARHYRRANKPWSESSFAGPSAAHPSACSTSTSNSTAGRGESTLGPGALPLRPSPPV